ncbi:unnamed protein product, partial [Laminaria digitata]
CHGLPALGGHLALKSTFDKVRDRFWCPTIHIDVRQHVDNRWRCQPREMSRRSPHGSGQLLRTMCRFRVWR